ncbi:hypothetical protein [Aeromonas phage AS-yj]|uniref:Uncharacterized protein n=7 Tax=Caudoviricetes TaxID=2731619 RepID=A0A291LDB0_9CAUD|nr:hypothetical protein F485_gp038 [Aeromonas phage CC2]YP_009834636.1 hypothetical protein HWB28_gp336 [Aeromonas phage AS-zj]YP_009834869.1 hypothetical protein HWB29_gp167 [Aeromonas phage AS-sw]ATI17378.1 hypothetical protein [Aeromonas phage AS-szw]ATI17717.1 hypothetical protein [Aeromonas phage AS-yj]QAX97819.1 hypothetical protein ASswx1_175 [Aeromonas phage Asswx_1]QAX99127.1 hypothetical protein assk_342 [Aeromonas phage Assk]QMV28774.1 hypothetical protein AP1_0056 [Aeromonas phag
MGKTFRRKNEKHLDSWYGDELKVNRDLGDKYPSYPESGVKDRYNTLSRQRDRKLKHDIMHGNHDVFVDDDYEMKKANAGYQYS